MCALQPNWSIFLYPSFFNFLRPLFLIQLDGPSTFLFSLSSHSQLILFLMLGFFIWIYNSIGNNVIYFKFDGRNLWKHFGILNWIFKKPTFIRSKYFLKSVWWHWYSSIDEVNTLRATTSLFCMCTKQTNLTTLESNKK